MISKKQIPVLVLLLAMLIFSYTELLATKNDQPNIIFILADDLGIGDLNITGHPYARTPNVDKLASQGISFERAYMPGSWCAPSRYGLMTGKYPARHFDDTHDIRPDEHTITKILNDAGYKTAHFGKWHINKRDNKIVTPYDFGIDEYFITNGPHDGKTWTREQRNKEYWRAESTDAYVDMTIDFIDENTSNNSSSPFYVNLWVYPTHSYINPTPEQLAVYENLKVNYEDFSPHQQEFLKFVAKHGDIDKAMQAYCADVTAMDKALGRLFDFIEKKGLKENTLIVFTSDNGPAPLASQVKDQSIIERYEKRPTLLNNVGSAKFYRERKISLYEGGIRVPFIASWPKQIPKGKVDGTSVIHGIDWLPTVGSICNLELPEGIYDGMDVKAAFKGNTIERKEPLYWTQAGRIAILKENWKGVRKRNGEIELYNLLKDPSELKNVKTKHPEIADELEAYIVKWSEEIRTDE